MTAARTIVAGALALACVVGVMGQSAGLSAQTGPGSSVPAAAPINLNTATAVEFEKLPGVGPAMAARIVEYRQKNEGFKKIEDRLEILESAKSSDDF